jgi:Phage tail tube protein
MALVERTVVLAKKETNYGTDAAPAGTDGVLCMNVRPDVRFQSIMRNPQKQSLGNYPYIPETGGNAAGGGISFDVELRGAGSAYTTALLPKVDPLLQACGLTLTVSSGTSASYAPVSTGIPGCTIWAYLDGQLNKYVGCRGSVKLSLKAGQPAVWSFTMQSLTTVLSDASLVAGTYEAANTTPPAWVKYSTNSALKIGTGNIEAIVTAVEIDLGMNVQVAPNANTGNNRNEIVLAGRDVGGSMDPELVAVATYDYLAKMIAGSTESMTIQVGGTQFNKVTITCPRTVFGQIGWAERAGKRTLSIPFKIAESAGDDELTILYN